MKAQKGNRRLRICLPAVFLLIVCPGIYAQQFSAEKNLHELRKAVFSGGKNSVMPGLFRENVYFKRRNSEKNQPRSAVFLPRWSVECLPFFCRIEHKFAKISVVPVKFRLGSVEYVDWLEGKTRFPTFAPQ